MKYFILKSPALVTFINLENVDFIKIEGTRFEAYSNNNKLDFIASLEDLEGIITKLEKLTENK